jgi:4-aminobutyrate aminotransferase-like enzyme
MEVIERDHLADHVRKTGDWLSAELQRWVIQYPDVVRNARGIGFMQGVELQDRESIRAFADIDKAPSLQMVNRLHEAGLLTIPSGTNVVRFLPALNLPQSQLAEGLALFERTIQEVR